MNEFKKLFTAEGAALPEVPWNVYPRPQLRRDSFLCLNGRWDFAVTPDTQPPTDYDRTICVPFAPETLLSGIGEVFPEESSRWYRRRFTLPEGFCRDRVILHIGAADQYATVYVNDHPIGTHTGGYEHFSIDITDALQPENTLTIRIEDRLSELKLPYGKQSNTRGGMWYTPTSGIWQTVWIESVPAQYIQSLHITTGAHDVKIQVTGISDGLITVQTPTGPQTAPVHDGVAVMALDAPRMWSPEDPYLYEFAVDAGNDHVESYFALRTLEIRTVHNIPRLCLNGQPYFFHGLLDQGYWSDGLLTPAAPECYAQDILRMKKLGFNMLRKHIKVEPEQFYYDCDRLGMVVFQDMVNNGSYSFFRDTALPTVGIRRMNDRFLHRDKETRQHFITAMEQTVAQLRNHPCICYWTIFNEGWGQFTSSKMYGHLRALDDSRLIDSTSGWFFCGKTDVNSHHLYFRKIKLPMNKKPLVLSEFGGYSWKPEGHVFNTEQTYGYGKYENREEFVAALRHLYLDEIVPLVPTGLCAAIYTQVSDVEDETNGLLSFDRHIEKVRPEEFTDISQMLYEAMKSAQE